ncbi:MAG: HAD family hydrolase [Candidatus Aminicenantes bacterium]|nr:HAD family hydrolase [Candidatus Aminicenantes bacterium]
MNFKAVIFDLDGTLLDSLGGIAFAMNRVLEQWGYPVHPPVDYRKFVGSGIRETVLCALPGSAPGKCDIEKFIKEYRQIYDKIWPRESAPYAGITGLLENLNKQKIKTAVLSNKSDDFTKRMAAKLLPGFDFRVVWGGRPGVPLKPDPAAALEIAGILGFSPGACIFLGDSGIDMETAVNAGMYGIGVLWGFREAEELLSSGAKRLIADPEELLDII